MRDDAIREGALDAANHHFALIGSAAGATHTSLWRFSWTTVVGYLPLPCRPQQ